MSDWDAALYRRFEDDRTRPARELLARVPLDTAKLAFDLGCGPGNSTELIAERFPQACRFLAGDARGGQEAPPGGAFRAW